MKIDDIEPWHIKDWTDGAVSPILYYQSYISLCEVQTGRVLPFWTPRNSVVKIHAKLETIGDICKHVADKLSCWLDVIKFQQKHK